jgi:hypothetical protein
VYSSYVGDRIYTQVYLIKSYHSPIPMACSELYSSSGLRFRKYDLWNQVSVNPWKFFVFKHIELISPNRYKAPRQGNGYLIVSVYTLSPISLWIFARIRDLSQEDVADTFELSYHSNRLFFSF